MLYVQSCRRMLVSGFDGDDGDREKRRKHGVPLAGIEGLFAGAGPRAAPDVKHPDAGNRFIAAGRTAPGRLFFVAFTIRVRHVRRPIRPVSACCMR